MSLTVLCLGTRYDVCECNCLRDMTINSFLVFDLHLWPWAYVKVNFTLTSRCTLCSCTLVPSIKFVGSIKFEIWTIFCRKRKWRQNDVITHSNLIKFKNKSTKDISKLQTEFHFDRTYRGLKSKVGKLTENYEGKMDITSLWPWPLIQGHQFL